MKHQIDFLISEIEKIKVLAKYRKEIRRVAQRKMDLNKISYDIIGAAMKIHTDLGPGLLESVYELPMAYKLRKMGYDVKTQVGIPFIYEEFKFEAGFRLDILVNDSVVLEIKSVDTLMDVHHKQLLTYLKLADKRLGLLINFNSVSLKDSIVRIVNKF